MLATLLIVFREVLEAALIIGIVAAACRGLPRAWMWIGIGAGAGVLGALALAAGAQTLSAAASGMGAEIFNAAVLGVAAAMLGWHLVWMSRHGRELSARAQALGQGVAEGGKPLYAVAVVCGAAVLREGAETVLFLYGIAAGGDDSTASMLLGGALGLAIGLAVGLAIYLGLSFVPTRKLFHVTNGMIVLLASGLVAQAFGYLIQADLVPSLIDVAWDTSWLLSEASLLGKLLHTLIGYIERPAGIQVLAYIATLIAILGASRLAREPALKPAPDGLKIG